MPVVAVFGPPHPTVLAVTVASAVLPTSSIFPLCTPSAVELNPPVVAMFSEQVNVVAVVMLSSQAELALRAVALVAFGT